MDWCLVPLAYPPHTQVTLQQLQFDSAATLLLRAGVVLPPRSGDNDVAYLQAVLDALCELTSTDPLTGLQNRRAFVPILERELDRVARGAEQALLLIVDIDHFKHVNDNFGHLVGDMVIREVAAALRNSVRPMDSVARIGGEEFCVVCPNCPPAFAQVVAQRIRSSVESAEILVPDHPPIKVTVSCGGAFAIPGIRARVDEWLERADRQMYCAKADGRNCVRLEEVSTPEVSAEEKGLLLGWSEPDPLIVHNSRAE